ncbi:MAG: M28 family peptidase [Nitrospira sp.]|nr:M28 family peptidase [Nitrospira sp.]
MSHRLRAHLEALVGERHPLSAPLHLQQVEQYLVRQLAAAGLAVTTQEFHAMDGLHRNVIGTVRPTPISPKEAGPPLILAAHYDTVEGSPGADDNASALAVLLEVAHRIGSERFQRPVRFIAFALEEPGLFGSQAYTTHLVTGGQSIQGAIVLECVGYASNEEGSQTIPPGVPISVPTTGNFLGVIGNQASALFTQSVAHTMARHLPIIPLIVPGNGELLPDTRRSDHTAFWERGFPAVMLTDTANFRNPHYHQPTDTIDTLNLDFVESVTEALTAVVMELAKREAQETGS